ncbi:MAG TPA: hypothetical protein VGI12_04280 [Vicinamibacterales bacterium]|jgi:hypothetical protein
MRILRGLTSRILPCGCAAGVYETYDGIVVTLIDERQTACAEPSHLEGEAIPEGAGVGQNSETNPSRDRHTGS